MGRCHKSAERNVFPAFLERFLPSNLEFGHYLINIQGNSETLLMIKNSNELLLFYSKSIRYKNYSAILFSISILLLNKFSEFLYFNF